MEVGLITNLTRSRSPSMALYAERLREAFRARTGGAIELSMVDPWLDLESGTAIDKPWYYLNRLALFPLQLRARGVRHDVVHVVDHAAADLAGHAGRPTVVTVHDLIPLKLLRGELGGGPGLRISYPAASLFLFALRALAKVDAVIVTSEATLRDLRRFGVVLPARTRVVYHGVDDRFFRPVPKRAPPSGRPFLLLSVGNAHPYKNTSSLVDAYLSLRARGLDVELTRVGSLPSGCAAKLAGVPLRFFAGLSRAELADEYSRADLLCFPSLDEGFGWPPLESMAAGTPALTSKCGALLETAGPAASLEDPADVGAVAEGIARFVRDRDYYEAQAALGHAHAQRFRWSVAAEATAEVYRDLV